MRGSPDANPEPSPEQTSDTAHSPAKPDLRLPRSRKIVHTKSFQRVYEQGRRWIGRYMVLWTADGETAGLRIGVVASRKVGGAVERNLAKRRLREAFRTNQYRWKGSIDVVLIARRAIIEARAANVEQELLQLADRAGLTSGSIIGENRDS